MSLETEQLANGIGNILLEQRDTCLPDDQTQDLVPGARIGPNDPHGSHPVRVVAVRPDLLGLAAPTVQVIRNLGQGAYSSLHVVRQVAGAPLPSPVGAEGDGDQVLLLTCLSKYYLSPARVATEVDDCQSHLSLPVHANLVTRYAVLDTPNHVFILNELVSGYDLFYLLEQSPVRPNRPNQSSEATSSSRPQEDLGPLTWLALTDGPSLLCHGRMRVIIDLFSQLCDAIQVLHDCGLAHRDIIPQNCVITTNTSRRRSCTYDDNSTGCEGRVSLKLMDLRHVTTAAECDDEGCTTDPYLAPECVQSQPRHGYDPKRSDVWNLGIVLLNLLFHRNPFRRARTAVCPSYAYFASNPTDFLLLAFDGLPRHVAQFVADHILQPDPALRSSPAQIAHWARTALLPDLAPTASEQSDRTASRGAAMGFTLPLTCEPPRSRSVSRSRSRPARSLSRPASTTQTSQTTPPTSVRGRSRNAYSYSYGEGSDYESERPEPVSAATSRPLSCTDHSPTDAPCHPSGRRRKRGNRRATSAPKQPSHSARSSSEQTRSSGAVTPSWVDSEVAGSLAPSPYLSPVSSRGASPHCSSALGSLLNGSRSRDGSVFPGQFPDQAARTLGTHLPARPMTEAPRSRSSIETDRLSHASVAASISGSGSVVPRGFGTPSHLPTRPPMTCNPSIVTQDDTASIFSAWTSVSAPVGPTSRRSVDSVHSARTTRTVEGGGSLWNRNLQPISEFRSRSPPVPPPTTTTLTNRTQSSPHSRSSSNRSKSRARRNLDASYLVEIFGASATRQPSTSTTQQQRSLPNMPLGNNETIRFTPSSSTQDRVHRPSTRSSSKNPLTKAGFPPRSSDSVATLQDDWRATAAASPLACGSNSYPTGLDVPTSTVPEPTSRSFTKLFRTSRRDGILQ